MIQSINLPVPANRSTLREVMVESYSKAIEACQFELRLKSLEENRKTEGKYEICE